MSNGQQFAPPSGPPPTYTPPSGPPPTYAPPRAPPPQRHYAPPPGPPPPPSYGEIQERYLAEPAPPPPVESWYASPALNASEDEAEAGWRYVREHPLQRPRVLAPLEREQRRRGEMYLLAPSQAQHQRGVYTTRSAADGTSFIRSERGCPDTTLLSHVPLYSALDRHEAGGDTVYYELQVVSLGHDASLAIGFAALPYPPFRLPGWHRASIGVHADDGHRFACTADGGVPLTEPFAPGDVVGLGIALRAGQVWFTRNGALAGGWNLREGRTEEADEEGNEWVGLEGERDVYAAVGICGQASAVVNLAGPRAGRPWMWAPNPFSG